MTFSSKAFQNPNVRRVFCGQLISQTCDKMMSVGLIWVFTRQYSESVIPLFLGASALPHLVLSWRAGAWANACGPLRTVVASDLFRGILFLILFALWPNLPESGQLAALFAFSIVSNIAGALFNPAIMALPVYLPEKNLLQEATALIDSCFSIGNVLGPLLAALFYPYCGLTGLFLFNAASYLFAAWLGARVNLSVADAEAEPASSGYSLGILELLRSDELLAFLLAGYLAINLLLAPLMVFLPLFVKHAFNGQIHTLALLEASVALGMVLGGLFLSAVRFDLGAGMKIAGGMIGVAAADVVFSLSGRVWIACLALGILGACLSAVNIFSLNLFQSRPKPRNVPVVMSLVNLISVSSLPFSMGLMAMVMGRVDVRALAVCLSILLLMATAAVASNKELRSQ